MSIEDDIDRRVGEKFQTWLTDAMELYKMADIEFDHATHHVVYLMLMGAISGMASSGVSRNGAQEMAALCHDRVSAQVRKHKLKRKEQP